MTIKKFIENLVYYIVSTNFVNDISSSEPEFDLKPIDESPDLESYINTRVSMCERWLSDENNKKLIKDYLESLKETEDRDDYIEEILDIIYTMFPIVHGITGESFEIIQKLTLNFFINYNDSTG